MQFNSYFFLLIFLPLLTFGYFMANKINSIFGKIWLTIGCAVFYLYGGWDNAKLLGVSIALNLFFTWLLTKTDRWKKWLLSADLLANIGLLFYFKYFNFFLSGINSLFKTEYPSQSILLPLGISFFTFQQIMYVFAVYKGEISKINLLDYLVTILYFPKLIMGPLMEPADLITQLNDSSRKKANWEHISYGLKLLSYGLFKKLILADTFAKAVSWGFSSYETATSMDCFLVMLFYTFEIYFDFSGYSDMAVGTSLMLNIKLPINFDSPYKALSIRDFWKRWHMSLTAFLTKYIYIPLGGSKKGRIRTYINTLIVFLVSGIWHGANWTFILWGVLHGLLSVLDRILEKQQKKLSETVRWMGTFFAVNLLWLLFRSDSITQWLDILLKMFTFQNMTVSDGLISAFVLPETNFLFRLFHLEAWNSAVRGFSLLLFTLGSLGLCLIPENNYKCAQKNTWITMVLSAVAFVWSFLCLSSESVFVYFNF